LHIQAATQRSTTQHDAAITQYNNDDEAQRSTSAVVTRSRTQHNAAWRSTAAGSDAAQRSTIRKEMQHKQYNLLPAENAAQRFRK
jgi:stress response protein SCP2